MLIAVGMTREAALAGLFGGQLLEGDDFRDVAAAFNVSGARPVAIFASVLARLDQCIVRGVEKTLVVNVLVAGFAGIRAYVAGLRRSLSLRRGQRLIAGRSLWRGTRSCSLREQRGRESYGENDCP